MLHYNLSGESGRRTGLHRVWQLSRIFAFVKTSRFARLDVWYLISLGLIALLIITCMVLVHQQTVLILLSRSEEHTSELQSLMRISYAVFCLKKKKNPL